MMKSLTLPQKNMYETEQFFDGTSMCNIGGLVFLNEDNINLEILEKSINEVIKNSDGLRIKVVEENFVPYQQSFDYTYEKLNVVDLTTNEYKEIVQSWMKETFDISKKLYDFKIVIIEDKTCVFIKLHHIVCDAWGVTLIVSKIIEYYDKFLHSIEIPTGDIPSYFKLIDKEEEYFKSTRYEKDESFWREKYKEKPTYVTMSPNKKSNLDVEAGRSSFTVPIAETEALLKYCSDNQISPAVLLEAITTLYAARINNADSITLCSLVLNRNGVEEKNTVGMYNNILPLTVNIDYNETFLSLCQKIATEHYQVFRHQKYPLSKIMNYIRENHGKEVELYDIMVSYQNAQLSYEGGIEAKTEWIFNGTSDLGFMLNISDRDKDGRLDFDFDWRKNCFTADEIEKIYYRFINMVNQIVVNPTILCKDIDIVTYYEKEQILIDFNDTIKEYPKDKCLHYYLEENVLKNPGKIALRFEDKEITYKEFNEKVNSLANFIIKKITKRNSIIGVMTERSFEMLIAIYAIIKAGHAYMPMDPHFPKDRIEFMLEDSNAPLILTQSKWVNVFEDSDRVIDLNTFVFENYDNTNPDTTVVSMDTAYVIYTSGSTGKPKGAMIPHHSAINRIKWMHEKYPLKDGDVVLQKTPYTFDVSVWELFWWSMYNGTLQILIPKGHKDPAEIISGVEKGKVTHMHFVPSMLNAFLEYLEINKDKIKNLSTLRYVFASGEALQVEHVKKFYTLLKENKTTLHNLYGPTECTVDVSFYDCDESNIPNSIPIGKPVDNTQLLVLDKNHKLMPVGVVGELYISGSLVGKGYLNREELTREKFVPNLYYDYATMYKTGDLAMWLPDGNIEYCGRTDFQIKIRGLRVELGDIENAILRYEGIKQAIVTVFEVNGEKNLCAYYTSNTKIDIDDLKSVLMKVLPDYMVPSYYMELEKIPVNSNGKADRKAFPIPDVKMLETKYIAPKNKLEEEIQKIVQDVLKVEKISVEADLFACGLTSIGVISIITKLSGLGYELRVRDFYECHTILEIAELLEHFTVSTDDYEEDKKYYADISDIKNHLLPQKHGNSVLITGATSFLGIHIIDELIRKTDKNIYCFIRNREKFERFIRNYTSTDIENPRIIVVEGDITKDGLGFSKELVDDMKECVCDIIHCAADVSFFCPWEKSKLVNYIGTCNVLNFAKDIEAKLHHISTMSVSGDILTRQTQDAPDFTENELYIGQLYKENVYVHSKYLAEKEIIKAIRKNEVNASIYRVANLTWRVSDGKFQEKYESNDLYLLTKVMLHYNKIPLELLNENLAMAPADECATAIVSLLTVNENRVYNVYSKNSLDMSRYINALTSPDVITLKDFEDLLKSDIKFEEAKFVLMYISNIVNSPERAIVCFDNSYTTNMLESLGFNWAELNGEYAARILKYLE